MVVITSYIRHRTSKYQFVNKTENSQKGQQTVVPRVLRHEVNACLQRSEEGMVDGGQIKEALHHTLLPCQRGAIRVGEGLKITEAEIFISWPRQLGGKIDMYIVTTD